MSNDPKIVEKMLLESLKRLKREYIDVYMIHWPDPLVDIRKPIEVLRKYQEKSVINHMGLCNTNLDDLYKAREIGPIDCVQSELNILNTKAFDQLEDEWKKMFSMGWGTFDKGILTGRVFEGRKYDSSDARSWAPWWNKKEVTEKIKATARLKKILDDYQLSLPEFCIHSNLNRYGVSQCLVGFKTSNDYLEVNSILQKTIPSEIVEEIFNRWSK